MLLDLLTVVDRKNMIKSKKFEIGSLARTGSIYGFMLLRVSRTDAQSVTWRPVKQPVCGYLEKGRL